MIEFEFELLIVAETSEGTAASAEETRLAGTYRVGCSGHVPQQLRVESSACQVHAGQPADAR